MDKHRHFFLNKEVIDELAKEQKESKNKRPYTDEIGEHAYSIIANGGSLKSIAEYYGVHRSAAHKWLLRDPEKYAAAKEARAALRVEDMFDSMQDMIEGKIDAGVYHQIKDTIKWTSGKESKQYSDKDNKEEKEKVMTYEEALKHYGVDYGKS